DHSFITIRFRIQGGEDMSFKVKRSVTMDRVMDSCARKRGVHRRDFRFTLDDGKYVGDDSTPQDLKLEDNAQIDVWLPQCG
ncbi:hypothetical protein B484DRAFT_318659, partial [Ochromonadaceae sp. CCMP2298]